ncbi:MAG: hypothetical protein WCP10_13240 [Desulfuromonadales bacterium]
MVDKKSIYAGIAGRIRRLPPEANVTSYEWEELVQKMSNSDDPGLREIGRDEAAKLKNLDH